MPIEPIDISMSSALRKRRRNAGYAGICAVGLVGEPGVFRLATAENIEAHLTVLEPGSWWPLQFERVLWTPGPAVARTIVTNTESFLITWGFELGRHWYRAGLDMLDDLIAAEVARLNSPTWSHQELIALLQEQSNQRADRAARGEF